MGSTHYGRDGTIELPPRGIPPAASLRRRKELVLEERPTRLPLLLRALNRVGGAARALGLPLLAIDPDRLLAEASSRTGLSDFGDDRFRAPFRLLCEAYEADARLTPFGRLVARRDALRLLENRLRLQDTWSRHRSILAGPVRAPLFVLGLPRTGTSILHELLAQDPAPCGSPRRGRCSRSGRRRSAPRSRRTRASPRPSGTSPGSTASCPSSGASTAWARGCRRSASPSPVTTSRPSSSTRATASPATRPGSTAPTSTGSTRPTAASSSTSSGAARRSAGC